MTGFSLQRVWRVLIDSLWLGVIRAALTAIQTAADALGLNADGRRAIIGRLEGMILASSPNEGAGSG
ncbi:MAG: hypothetical protein K6T74_08670 [Geminicoccaceae bacterium]|nr:hypothetical protein [Geminicoccaceae bacterium]